MGDTPADEVPFSEALTVTSALIPLCGSHVRIHAAAWVGSMVTEVKYLSKHFHCQWRQWEKSYNTASLNAGRWYIRILSYFETWGLMDCFRKLMVRGEINWLCQIWSWASSLLVGRYSRAAQSDNIYTVWYKSAPDGLAYKRQIVSFDWIQIFIGFL